MTEPGGTMVSFAVEPTDDGEAFEAVARFDDGEMWVINKRYPDFESADKALKRLWKDMQSNGMRLVSSANSAMN